MIKENLELVEQNICEACQRAGRLRSDVTLIAVSKTNPVVSLREAMDCGIQIFGENKVQEMLEKQQELPETLQWHMIGHLQRNKVKYIMGKVALIHSVDSLRLAEEISKEAEKQGTEEDILVEINVAEEISKFGITTEEALQLIQDIAKLPHIHIKGLMTIAPFVENPEENRGVFRALKKLSVDIEKKNIDNVTMNVLSMGMTNDYQIAIEEGATMVRVGTGIFGTRSYTA
ncbi:MAG: YggS family pyridoxal phosphate-dependent enzyme [Lachnospiraceae bacterium]|nr:YggS family pyridoxal phosphate-dependent enzyme [Lachnospiraceae bacterium]